MDPNPLSATKSQPQEVFRPGAIVVLSLSSPREKLWGILLQLTPTGVGLRGIDLSSFDETIRMLRHSEPITPSEIFFPLHRVERIEIDAPSCGVPSLGERFESTTGISLCTFLQC